MSDKKVVIPINRSDPGGPLDQPFPTPTEEYSEEIRPEAVVDLPYEEQTPEGGVEAVSIKGTRNRFFNRAVKTNKYQPDASDKLTSEKGFESDPTNLDFPGTSTLTLGTLMKKGLPGRRTKQTDPGADLKQVYDEMDTETRGKNAPPHARAFNSESTPADGGEASSYDPLSKEIQNSVLTRNRFSIISDGTEGTGKFVNNHEGQNAANAIDEQKFTVLQEMLGAYDKNETALTMEDMKTIAATLMENAFEKSGQGNKTDNESSHDYSKVSSNEMSAQKAIDPNYLKKGSYGAFNDAGSQDSYGVMNTDAKKFDDMSSDAAVSMANALIAATKAVISQKIKAGAPGARPTRNDFVKSTEKGMEVFTADLNTKSAPGFYITFSREIIRDTLDLSTQFAATNLTSSDVATAGQLKMLETLRKSKVMAAINAFSAIGDIAIDQERGIYNTDRIRSSFIGIDLASAVSHKSKRDSSNIEFGDSQKTQTPNDRRLTWRGSATPSLFLLPPSVEFAHTNTGQSGLISTAHSNLKSTTLVKSKKLSKEDVARHERRLDAEYVPFYFQDLRTNEIISFHAFLSQLEESYTPRYSEERMIGRADPVRIYQGTSRSISLRFVLTATSREDFNEMWMKFNKMITLLYPQYTKGRTTMSEDNATKIAMPFSQIMSSSPMIRLRVGDVIRSNYSRFNLGRLFGAGTTDYDPGNEPRKAATRWVHPDTKANAIALAEAGLEGLIAMNKSIMSPAFLKGAANLVDGLKLLVARARTRPLRASQIDATGLMFGDVVRVPYPEVRSLRLVPETKGQADGRNTGEDPLYLPYRDVYARVMGKATVDGEIKYRVMLFADAQALFTPLAGTFGNQYYLDHGDMQVFASGLILAQAVLLGLKGFTGGVGLNVPGKGQNGQPLGVGPGLDYFKRAVEFLRPKSNAVVRSFEEASGKGLGGFITSMQMTWINDRNVWETDLNARAPKTFEIQMQFAPIHDISPGLDHDGYTRAINYPVGEIANTLSGDETWLDELGVALANPETAGAGLRYALDSDYVDETRELVLRDPQDGWDEAALAAMRLLGKAVR